MEMPVLGSGRKHGEVQDVTSAALELKVCLFASHNEKQTFRSHISHRLRICCAPSMQRPE